MIQTLHILLVEDNPGDADLIMDMLSEHPVVDFNFSCESYLKDAVARLSQETFDLILLDLGLPDSNGIETLHDILKHAPATAIIVITGVDDTKTGVEAVRQGAQDYLVKGRIESNLLSRALLYAYERKCTEGRMKAALEEKSVLLRELYHRTKNNMQVIAAMLALRAAYTHDERIISLAQDIETKIHGMALVHQKLYQSQNLSRINLQEYLSDLVELLMSSYHIPPDKIAWKLDADPLEALIDTATPLGLVLNELLSNALKHAFPGERHGQISIRMLRTAEGEIDLMVADDGIGMPKGFDIKTSKALGLQTVVNLVEQQLQGTITWDTRQGVICYIRFTDNLYTERV